LISPSRCHRQQATVEKNRTTVFGKLLLTGRAREQANVLVFAVSDADVDISFAAKTVWGAGFLLAAILIEIVHDQLQWESPGKTMPARQKA